jgi:hypothetical protein
VLAAVAAVLCVGGETVDAQSPTDLDGYVWLDANGDPLPFQDHETIMEVMRSARVVSREKVPRGVAGVEKLGLEHEGIRFHAAFRSVDVTARKTPQGGVRNSRKKYRDAAIFERAAYELSELLGVGRVPPVVVRRVDEVVGTVQIWMEGTRPEVELIQNQQLQPPDVVRWSQQKRIMGFFDNLICNSDRNQGNILIDGSWNIWFIDHTRAFKRSSRLLYVDRINRCERRLWSAVHEIDEETLRRRLEPYLESQEISKLLRRRKQMIRRIQGLIDKKGEEAVLFDLKAPGSELADWSE